MTYSEIKQTTDSCVITEVRIAINLLSIQIGDHLVTAAMVSNLWPMWKSKQNILDNKKKKRS